MKFTIVTPTLNSKRFLLRALESVRSQSHQGVEVEHIIIDGGSTDATLTIARKFGASVLSEPDTGMYDALNKGLRPASGAVFSYLNSDDELAPGALKYVAQIFTSMNAQMWIAGATRLIDAESDSIAIMRAPVRMGRRRFAALRWNCFPQPSVFMRTDFIRHLGGFNDKFQLAGDYDLFLRALRVNRPLTTKRVLSHFRLHDANLSHDNPGVTEESLIVSNSEQLSPAVASLLRLTVRIQLNALSPGWFLAKKMGRIRY